VFLCIVAILLLSTRRRSSFSFPPSTNIGQIQIAVAVVLFQVWISFPFWISDMGVCFRFVIFPFVSCRRRFVSGS
jgi:hypothetical protein